MHARECACMISSTFFPFLPAPKEFKEFRVVSLQAQGMSVSRNQALFLQEKICWLYRAPQFPPPSGSWPTTGPTPSSGFYRYCMYMMHRLTYKTQNKTKQSEIIFFRRNSCYVSKLLSLLQIYKKVLFKLNNLNYIRLYFCISLFYDLPVFNRTRSTHFINYWGESYIEKALNIVFKIKI